MKWFTAALCILIALSPAAAGALSSTDLTSAQVENIRNACKDTQLALRQVTITDAVSYVNLSQQYNIISTHLMAPMTSRVSLNKLDGVELTKTTVSFNTSITDFKAQYAAYKQLSSTALGMNCYDRPIEFYDTLTALLSKRTETRQTTDKLTSLIAQYRTQLQDIKKQAQKGTA